MSLSDLKRNWLLKQLGLSGSNLSETDLLTQLYGDASFNAGVRRVNIPMPPSLQYFFPVGGSAPSTSNTLGNGTLRLTSFICHEPISIDRIGAEITAVGEAGSKVRLGVYKSDANGKPGDLVLDAGQINGDSATIQELVCNASLDAGIYFVGGAVQSAPVTQPTIRAINGATVPETPLPLGTFIPGAAANFFAYMLGGVAGALPASGSALTPTAGIAPRVFVRIK